MTLSVIILAAGKGTRMNSRLPKVLQPLAGQPLLGHVLNQSHRVQADRIIVVYGHGGDHVQDTFKSQNIEWVEQAEQLGTGHAVQVTLPVLPTTGQSLILYGDVPLVRPETLQQLRQAASSGIAMITLNVADPMGYGRIVRDDSPKNQGKIQRIVEHKDASDAEKQITEINTGIYCVDNARLHQWLPKLSNNNVQGEYYLTDIVEMAVADGLEIGSVQPEFDFEVEGVNDRLQLSSLERRYQAYQASQLLKAGVTLFDPARFDLRGNLTVGKDVRIDANVIIEGDCYLGDGVVVGAGCILKNVRVGAGTVIQPYSVLDDAVVGSNVALGPFARLRPGTELADDVHIGNFVEVKNSRIAKGSKANHLAYVGDAMVGSGSNIGAGTITCNYDGAFKHQTVIGDNAFIGSNSSLVAPVEIGHGATVGAGSVVTKNVPADALAVARGLQRNIDNYQRPKKVK